LFDYVLTPAQFYLGKRVAYIYKVKKSAADKTV
jgi:hypothetical protein